jgi:Na+-driven multidrug efflux pump
MLVNAVYNIVDRIYVGQGVDPLGIAGISIVMPAMMVLMGMSMLIGVGANSLFAIRLGEGRRDEVEKIMGHAFVLLFALPLIAIVLRLVFLDDILVHILGASEAVFPYAKTYFQIILYGAVFSAMGPGVNHFIRSDGHPRTSMATQLIGAGFALIQLFPNVFIALFSKEDGELRDISGYCLRVSTMLFPIIAFQIFSSQYFQAVGKPVQSTILSLSRQILFYIPFLLLLPKAFGLDGVFFAMPAADMLAALVSAVFMFFELQRLKRLE